MTMKPNPMVILTGPTAVGKTALSIALAKKINGAIISADSMQVYKYMDIGSAKIMPEEMDGVRHYLVDELNPSDEFHVVRFVEMAKQALKEITANGQIPIVVGGTGFYIQALLYDIDFTEQECDSAYRRQLEELAETRGEIHAPAAEGDAFELAGEILRHGERILEMDADHAVPSEGYLRGGVVAPGGEVADIRVDREPRRGEDGLVF